MCHIEYIKTNIKSIETHTHSFIHSLTHSLNVINYFQINKIKTTTKNVVTHSHAPKSYMWIYQFIYFFFICMLCIYFFIYYIVNRFVFHLLGALSCNLAVRESTLFHRLFATAYFVFGIYWIVHTHTHTFKNIQTHMRKQREKDKESERASEEEKNNTHTTAIERERKRKRGKIENMTLSQCVSVRQCVCAYACIYVAS